MNPEVREVFRKRSAIISLIRRYMESAGYLEVETPKMACIIAAVWLDLGKIRKLRLGSLGSRDGGVRLLAVLANHFRLVTRPKHADSWQPVHVPSRHPA